MPNEFNTRIIEAKVSSIPNDKNFQNIIREGRTADLEDILLKMYLEPTTFGEYLFPYIHKKFLSDFETDFRKIPTDVYYATIKTEFAKNGLKGKGSLDFSITTPLNKIKELFSSPSANIHRHVIYLFAYGLGMTLEETQNLIQRTLLQPPVNLREYKEVIYYWYLLHNSFDNRVNRIQDMLTYYKELGISQLPPTTSTIQKDTLHLLGVMEKLTSEEELKNYLAQLKVFDSRYHINSKSVLEVFKRNLKDMPRDDAGKPDNLEEGTQTDLEDEKFDSALQCTKIITSLDSSRIAAYKEMIKQETRLLDPSLSLLVFQDIQWTYKSLQHRFDGSVRVSRNELLLSEFLIYTPELSEIAFRPKNLSQLKYMHYRGFCDYMNESLESCNLHEFYWRNPFELFLSICLYHEKPYEYLMANWHQAILYQTSNA